MQGTDMQAASTGASSGAPSDFASAARAAAPGANATSAYQGYQIIRRNGSVVVFEPNKIAVALMKAFLAVHGTQGAASASVRETVDELTQIVVRALLRSRPGGGTFPIEDVQDHVELSLMRGSHHEVARAYVLYRERRAQERARQAANAVAAEPALTVIDAEDVRKLRQRHPGVPIVAYVNTSAAVKAEVDVCCTSANAVQVVADVADAASAVTTAATWVVDAGDPVTRQV